MTYSRLRELVDESYLGGKHWYTSIRKVSGIASTQGSVVDFSMAPGTPRANYYVGDALTAKTLTSSYGIWTGGDVSPATKHLRSLMLLSNNAGIAPANFTLCDYLLFYPLIDMDSMDEQFLDNAVTLPRYTTGDGVQAFLVATNPYTGGSQFSINYTNQSGVSGRTSRIMTSNTNTYISTVVHSGVASGMHGTFINLAPGDTGIRSVQSVTFLSPNGGLACLVLCMPLANAYIRDVNAYAEWDFLMMKPTLPRIYDGAFLGLIGAVNGSASGQLIQGEIQVIWN